MKQKISQFLNKIDLVNSAFLLGTPIIGIGGAIYWWQSDSAHWMTVVLAILMAIATGIGITGGYHRLFSHKSYDAKPFYKLMMLLFGAAAFENSALHWASDHRNHHKYVDTDQDPYNINRGFWYAHMGWVMMKYDVAHRYDNVPDLEADKLIAWQNRHFMKIGVVVGLIMPALVASLWGDFWGGLLIAGVLRTVMNHHFTFSINSFAHLIGRRPYSDQDTSRDSWFLALFTYGEGYHNYHHKFPADYRNGIKAYHWDPTKWLVKILAATGQTYNLRKIPNETILRAKLRMDEKRIMRRMNHAAVPRHHVPQELIVATRLKIEEAYAKFRALRAELHKLKEEKLSALSTQIEHLHARIEAIKAEIKRAQQSLLHATAEWREICGKFGVPYTALHFNT